MAFLDELGKKTKAEASAATEMAKNAAGVLSDAAQKTADTVKVNAAVLQEQHELDKNYRTLGEWFVTEYDGQVPEAVADLVAAIQAGKEKIALLKSSLQQTEAAPAEPAEVAEKVCPVCGKTSSGRFCPHCGAPLD